MGNLPQIEQPRTLPISLTIPNYLLDHQFQGQPVLPAVEAMEILVRTLNGEHPEIPVNHVSDICFDKFLPLDPSSGRLEALVELKRIGKDIWQAALKTRSKAPKAAITRTKEHARLTIGRSRLPLQHWPLDVVAAPEGLCLSVAPEKIYADLVPFGPSFRNIVAPIHISPDGALARIKSPLQKDCLCNDPVLGSPFALDAAMHAACVWSQHFAGVVAFPVAIEARTIFKPVQAESTCYGRIIPGEPSGDRLIFDIAILDEDGVLCEVSRGVHMRDVSAGRLKPPQWIRCIDEPDPLARIRGMSAGLAIIESDAVAPFAVGILTPDEKKRFEKQGSKRQKSFLAGRLAMKRLYSRCFRDRVSTVENNYDTNHDDSPPPRCQEVGATPEIAGFHCSLSHDRRFAVAVAGSTPVGVDVESVSEKLLKSTHIFMNASERQQVIKNALGGTAAALRVWSIKEAAAKSFSMTLADAWHKVQVTLIGRDSSRFEVAGMTMEAGHAQVDEHLVSMVVRP